MSEQRFVTEDELIQALTKVGQDLDGFAGKQTELAELVNTLAGTVNTLAGAVKKVTGKVGELTDHAEELGRARWRWRTLEPGPRRTALWYELAKFITWYNARYGHSAESVALWPCWPSHPVVVEELTGLMVAHDAAYAGEDPTDAIIAWHDRWLWPAIERIHTRPGGMKNCSAVSHDHRHVVDPGQVGPEALTAAIAADDALARELIGHSQAHHGAPPEGETPVADPVDRTQEIPLAAEPWPEDL